MSIVAKSVTEALPFELVNLQHWFQLAYVSTQQAQDFIDTFQPQTPEGEALKGIYADLLSLCMETMRQARIGHLPEELAALLAFQQAELEYLVQRRRGQRQAVPGRAAAD